MLYPVAIGNGCVGGVLLVGLVTHGEIVSISKCDISMDVIFLLFFAPKEDL